MEKHVIVDFLSRGESHLDFNKSFIKAIPSQFKIFKFIGNASHAQHLKFSKSSLLNQDNSNWKFRVTCLFFKLLFSRKNHITVLAFENYLFPILTIIFLPFFIGTKFTFIVHNNIPSLALGGLKTMPFKLMTKLFKIKLICLTSIGKEKMENLGYGKSSCFIPHMNYCHFKKNISEVNQNYSKNTTNIVLLGRQAHLFSEKVVNKVCLDNFRNLHFHVYGKNIKLNKSKNITVYNHRLSTSDYKSALYQCDYNLFPNHDTEYRPSGILLDSISALSPIIAPLQGHFNEFKNLEIGLFYNSQEEFFGLLEKLNNSPIKRSAYPISGFKIAQKLTSIEKFTTELNKVYSDFNQNEKNTHSTK